jgi:hypothetical protein
MVMARFLSRVLVLELATAAGSVMASAVVAASPHWPLPGTTLGWFAPWPLILILGVPGALLLAAACDTPGRLAAAAGVVVIILAGCGLGMASTTSSTAALIFLWFPMIECGLGGGAVALRLEQQRRERRA